MKFAIHPYMIFKIYVSTELETVQTFLVTISLQLYLKSKIWPFDFCNQVGVHGKKWTSLFLLYTGRAFLSSYNIFQQFIYFFSVKLLFLRVLRRDSDRLLKLYEMELPVLLLVFVYFFLWKQKSIFSVNIEPIFKYSWTKQRETNYQTIY